MAKEKEAPIQTGGTVKVKFLCASSEFNAVKGDIRELTEAQYKQHKPFCELVK